MSVRFGLSLPRLAVAGLLATLTLPTFGWDYADAARAKGQEARATTRHDASAPRHHAKAKGRKRVIHGPNYNPPYAEIAIDDNSGQVLREVNADAPRHPASLTKIMTLYLMFEQIEAGKFKLDTPLQVSAFAASQNPTKLGLKPNSTLKVEDAILGLVTKSANDAAVVVAEAIGGTQADFAVLMTEKAKALGMASTTYVNASGLPAVEQITTARDQALLGRAVQDRFPTFYRYFSTPSFRYRGREMRNHNALLGQFEGIDGIKTGYTEASGYNLTASVRRNNKHIVAVVLGGKSNAKRDARMRELLMECLPLASPQKTAPAVAVAPAAAIGIATPVRASVHDAR